MSTNDRPICDRFVDPALPEEQRTLLMQKYCMSQGFINERVNMSDWEDVCRVGQVFMGSCWSETANLLALAETIPLLEKT